MIDNSFESYQVNDYSYSATSAYWGTYLGIQSGSSTWGGTTAADGSMYLGLQIPRTPVVYQKITLHNQYTYLLSLYASSRSHDLNCRAPLYVYIGSSRVLYVSWPPFSSTMKYYSTTFTYSGQSGTTTLTLNTTLAGAGSTDCTVFVDAVALNVTGEKEKSAMQTINTSCFVNLPSRLIMSSFLSWL